MVVVGVTEHVVVREEAKPVKTREATGGRDVEEQAQHNTHALRKGGAVAVPL